LLELEKEEIIIKQPVPPAQIISLNNHAPIDLFIEIEFKIKSNFLQKHSWAKLMLKDIMKNIRMPFFIIMVFGSYAKGSQDSKSDIDLLMVVNEKDEIKNAEDMIQNAYTKIKKSINVVDLENFLEMLKNPEKLNIGNEAKKNHVLLHGAESYYQIVGNL
jgi:predicted nucleotidyltransferase